MAKYIMNKEAKSEMCCRSLTVRKQKSLDSEPDSMNCRVQAYDHFAHYLESECCGLNVCSKIHVMATCAIALRDGIFKK